jgi:hypothetical protein
MNAALNMNMTDGQTRAEVQIPIGARLVTEYA